MTTTIDVAALAMCNVIRQNNGFKPVPDMRNVENADIYRRQARAVLEAVRGVDRHGFLLSMWSERLVDAILGENGAKK